MADGVLLSAAEREALSRGKVLWSTVPGVEPGDLLPEGGGPPVPRPDDPAGTSGAAG